MDTPSQESSALDSNQAAALLADVMSPPPDKDETAAETPDTEIETKAEAPEAPAEESSDDLQEIEVDGKILKLSKAELAEAYKGQLRMADYTRKTMELASQRKEVSAEGEQYRQQRDMFAQQLQQQQSQLQALVEGQHQTDWGELLNSDPVEYMKQRHLLEQRQAALHQNMQQQRAIAQQQQAEQQENFARYLSQQQDELLAKLPEWKDEGKAKAEKTALAKYLVESGYGKDQVDNLSDHKTVIMARKAMLYDQMVSKAAVASKKVANLPNRVERPTVSDASPNLDRRNAQFQRLSKSGRAEDAAALLSNFL